LSSFLNTSILMRSSDGGVNDASKGFNDNTTSRDGYGGLAPYLYDAIVTFKKTEAYPSFCDLKENRNAHFHWRTRCKNFTVTDSGVLLYSGTNNKEIPATTRPVVRRGEVRLAIRYVHEKIGHAGQRQTNIVCARRLYWRSIHKDVAKYVNQCDFCARKRQIRKKCFQLGQISSPPPLESASSRAEELEMLELANRLALNSDDDLVDVLQEYYRPAESMQYAFFDDDVDESFHHLLEDDDETDVANTLSSMNGAYMMSLPRQQIKMDHGAHSSSSSMVYDDPSMPIIVADDFIPAGSNEIVTSVVSPSSKLESLPSPSEEEGLRLEERDRDEEEEEERRLMEEAEDEEEARQRQLRAVEGMMGDSPLGRRILARAEQTDNPSARKRRLIHPQHSGMMSIGNDANSRKRLMEENQVLRGRVSVLESAVHSEERANVAMQMRPVDEETAALQKNLLLLQREVLELQRTYWQAKLQQEGFHLQLGDYYEAAGAAEMVEQQEVHHHYDQEVEEEVLMEEHRVIEGTAMGNVH
ncbi:hypothetical protein PMAYCL1PPCAC_03718, partial [Pristionchus mayeri]